MPIVRPTRTVATCAAALLLHTHPALAATASDTMAVSATVVAVCTITTQPLAFGSYSAAALSATSAVTVGCTDGLPYNLGLDNGSGSGATLAARHLSSGANTLAYGLYHDPAHMAVWGGTVGTNTAPATGNGAPQTFTVYGAMPAGQFAAPGAYVDTVTATITY